MPVVQADWLKSPLSIIKDIFEKRGEEAGGDGCWGIDQFFENKLSNQEELVKVPCLHAESFKLLHDGCLVSYTGMIQDQFDPEYFFKVLHTSTSQGNQSTCCGLYTDYTQQPGMEEVNWEHPSNVMGDRQSLYCVPIPGETQWVRDHYHLSQMQSMLSTGAQEELAEPKNGTKSLKRKHEEGDEDAMEVGTCTETATECGSQFYGKKHCAAQSDEQGKHQDHDLNFPLPDERGLPCIVKVYKDFDNLKVGSVIQVVGVLSIHPLLAPLTYSESSMLETAAERKAHCPPPALVPRLHAITVRLLPHSNPLLPNVTYPVQPSDISRLLTSTNSVGGCRAVLLDMLTRILCGDHLTAEYVLLHLLSRVYGRMEVVALGKYSLNLSGSCVQTVSQPLHQFLCSLLTKCFMLPLTLDNMNTWRFTPKKDYDSNRILASVLQLSPGTEVLVDETVLTAGQLTQEGVANLKALGNVIQWQRLSYDFQFHTAEFDSDLHVLILSEGKSILKVDCHIPLSLTSPAPSPSPPSPPSPELINNLRCYFTLCSGLDYTLTPEMKSRLEEDFVSRRGSEAQLTGTQFHHLLSTARLLALSHGCTTLSPQHWTQACSMDQQRLHRIKSL